MEGTAYNLCNHGLPMMILYSDGMPRTFKFVRNITSGIDTDNLIVHTDIVMLPLKPIRCNFFLVISDDCIPISTSIVKYMISNELPLLIKNIIILNCSHVL